MTAYRDPRDCVDRACVERPLDLFFPQPFDHAGIAAATAVCSWCPVLGECAEWVLRIGLTDGVAAGTYLDSSHSKGERRSAVARLRKIAKYGKLPGSRRRRSVTAEAVAA